MAALGWRKRQILRKQNDQTPALQSIRIPVRSTNNKSVSNEVVCDKSCLDIDEPRREGYNTKYPCTTELGSARRTTEERSS